MPNNLKINEEIQQSTLRSHKVDYHNFSVLLDRASEVYCVCNLESQLYSVNIVFNCKYM